ncbi:MAG: prepilin-type N-terminal cleavage/methylation domain-containing protein [Candidatus Magasanikbacteria bacterium]|nr:prepilin-type N-terminal cleavage/methylation domain-containing protein [Candidatus Magasanikbacteria bacterium]
MKIDLNYKITPARSLGRGRHSSRGVTLVETLVVLALFLFISVMFISLYLQHGWLYQLGQAQFDAVGGARAAFNGVAPFTAPARQVAGSFSASNTIFTTGTTTLVLELPARDESGNTISGAFDYAVFYQSDNQFHRLIFPHASSTRLAEEKILSDTIAGLSFSYDQTDLALATKITLAVTSTAPGRRPATYQEQAEFILRNR